MAWTHSGWASQATVALRLSELRLFMAEVLDKIGNEKGADSYSIGSSSLQQLYDTLVKQEAKLSASAGAATNGGFSVARLVRGRDAR